MTARTPRTTREEREGLREAAERATRAHPSDVLALRLLADLRDAEAERDAAVERAERAEAAVGRVREVAADWQTTVYKIPAGWPGTVDEFCTYWFREPMRRALDVSDLLPPMRPHRADLRAALDAEFMGSERRAMAQVAATLRDGPSEEATARLTAALDAATGVQDGAGGAGRSPRHPESTGGLEGAQMGENEGSDTEGDE